MDTRFPKMHITTKSRKMTEHISTEAMEKMGAPSVYCLCVTLPLSSSYYA